MRTIKFRVWTGMEMEYRVVAGQLGVFYVEGMDPKDSACLSPFNTIYDKATPVMQFTGLHDKNGKEIYEGDTVRIDYDNLEEGAAIAEVKFHRGAFCYFYENEHDATDYGNAAEVIGNIYENPELLK